MTQEKITGQFVKIKSQDPSKWVLAIFRDKEGKTYMIYGSGVNIELFKTFTITASQQVSHANPKYRSTYKLISMEVPDVAQVSTREIDLSLIKMVEGVGPKTLEKWKNDHGEDFIAKFKANPEKYKDYYGPYYNSLKRFLNDFSGEAMKFFVNNNMTTLYSKLREDFGEETNIIEHIKNIGVYTLYTQYNYSFDIVDVLAAKLGVQICDPKRIEALIIYLINEYYKSENSTLISFAALSEKFFKRAKIFEVKNSQLISSTTFYNEFTKVFIDSVNSLLKEHILYMKKIQNQEYFALNEMRERERFIVKHLLEIRDKKLSTIASISSASLDPQQQEALINSLKHSVSIISGYPGTGKSYLIKYIAKNLIANGYETKDIKVLTPTGRAATILSDKLHKDLKGIRARTIHSFLKISKDEDLKSYLYDGSEDAKVIIIDEFSMVNIDIFYLLLSTCSDIERIIIVGDENQLPSIGAGNMLAEFMNSDLFAISRLNAIHRTDKIDIFNHFKDIPFGVFNAFDGENISFVESNSATTMLEKTLNLYEENLEKYGIDNVALLIPSYKADIGVNSVNNKLQEWYISKINNGIMPDPAWAITYKNSNNINSSQFNKLYIKDKVVQLVNDYEKDVFNGEIGYLEKFENNKYIVNFGNKKLVEYTPSEIRENLNLAYALTVHKFQGSESDIVIFAVSKEHSFMLYRKLVYTAVSRAKEKLFVIGESVTYRNAIVKDQFNRGAIITNMSEFLAEAKNNE